MPLLSVSKSGEHHDAHSIVAVMQDMMADMAKVNIRTDGLFLNTDTGFDCAVLHSLQKTMELLQTYAHQQQGME